MEEQSNVMQLNDGKLQLKKHSFDIREIMRKCTENLDAKYKIDDNVPPALLGDYRKLKYILESLLHFANKYKKNLLINISFANSDSENNRLIVSILNIKKLAKFDGDINWQEDMKIALKEVKNFSSPKDNRKIVEKNKTNRKKISSDISQNKLVLDNSESSYNLVLSKYYAKLMGGCIYHQITDTSFKLYFDVEFDYDANNIDYVIKQYADNFDHKKILLIGNDTKETGYIFSTLRNFGMIVLNCNRTKEINKLLREKFDFIIADYSLINSKNISIDNVPVVYYNANEKTKKKCIAKIDKINLFNICLKMLEKNKIKKSEEKKLKTSDENSKNVEIGKNLKSLVISSVNSNQIFISKILSEIGCSQIEILMDIADINKKNVRKLAKFNVIILDIIIAENTMLDTIKLMKQKRDVKNVFIIALVYDNIDENQKKILYKTGVDLLFCAPIEVKKISKALEFISNRIANNNNKK